MPGQTLFAVAVNYGTDELISSWASSLRAQVTGVVCVLVNNHFSVEASARARKQCDDLGILFIDSENIGYGAALNRGVEAARLAGLAIGDWLLLSNLDVIFDDIDLSLPLGSVQVPFCFEDNRNRNPFMTRVSVLALPLYALAAARRNKQLHRLARFLHKALLLIPSRPAAVHGSAFLFRLKEEILLGIFNSNVFLYCEELEFMSWARSMDYLFVSTKTAYRHVGGVSTSTSISGEKKFENWCASMQAWSLRWKY